MQHVDIKGLDGTIKNKRELHREFHEKSGVLIEKLVKRKILSSGIKDNHGKIRGWQVRYIGSGGGYAAVRATDSSSGNNSPGAITNYLENGHKFRKRLKTKRGNQKVLAARAFGFYKMSRGEADKVVSSEVKRLRNKLISQLNGGKLN